MLENLGTLSVVDRAGRTFRNPRSGEKLEVGPRKTVRFQVSPNFKRDLNDSAFDPLAVAQPHVRQRKQ